MKDMMEITTTDKPDSWIDTGQYGRIRYIDWLELERKRYRPERVTEIRYDKDYAGEVTVSLWCDRVVA
jgi:hypothetical protein